MPEILAVNNYYPFGMIIRSLSWQSDSYRFGFGGHEKDDEVKGVGNHLDFGGFGYDPRLIRRPRPDPVDQVSISNYAVFRNNPMIFVDTDGRKIKGVIYNAETGKYEYSTAAISRGTDKYIEARMVTKSGEQAISTLMSDIRTFTISVTDQLLVSTIPGRSGKYVFLGGEVKDKSLVVSSMTSDEVRTAIEGKGPNDIINVVYLRTDGTIARKQLKMKNIINILENPDLEKKYETEYSKAYRDSGMEEYEKEVNNQYKSAEQQIHGTGAHEEIHLLQINRKEKSPYKEELNAFSNQLKESKEYVEEKKDKINK